MAPRSVPGPAGPRPTASRPNPTRLRFALGTGGIAALSALLTAIVAPPSATSPSSAVAVPVAQATVTQQRPIQYVQLAAGQAAPAGATVIDAKAPKPITIVTTVPAPPQQTVVVRTTQSGKIIP
jgi:hypothetical protein